MKIQILLSTYNGGSYLRTQMDSILAQTVKNDLSLLIRDDGSTDDTEEIIRGYQEGCPWISYYKGRNIGVQRSFFELLANSDGDADYIAFADQDDEWLPEKLERAVERLQKMETEFSEGTPLLYCSDKLIVGKDLEELHVTVSRPVRKISFGNALVQDICTGCTAVINRAMAELLKKYPPKHVEDIVMHDWWLYLTASCFGAVYYDKNAYIRYRQHGNNTSGAMLNRRELLKYRLRELRKPRGEIYRQTEAFLETYRELLGVDEMREKREMAERLIGAGKGFFRRLLVAADRRYFRQRHGDDVVFRGILLVGKL